MASSSAGRPAHCRSSGAVHAWLDPTCFTPGTFPDPCSGGCSQAWYNQSPRPPSPRCQPNRLSPQPVTCVARGSPGPSVCSGRGPAPLLRAFQQRGSGTSDAYLPRGSRTQRVSNCQIPPPPQPDRPVFVLLPNWPGVCVPCLLPWPLPISSSLVFYVGLD